MTIWVATGPARRAIRVTGEVVSQPAPTVVISGVSPRDLPAGGEIELTAAVTSFGEPHLSWASSATGVATVENEDSLTVTVTHVGEGTATITVTVTDEFGTGTHSITVNAQATSEPLTAGTASATAGDGQVVLTWSAPSGGTAPYEYAVYRSESSGTKGSALTTELGVRNYTDETAVNGTEYFYTIDATDSAETPATVSYEQTEGATPQATPLSAGTIVATAGDEQVTISQGTAPVGGDGSYTRQLQSSADGESWSDISGATSLPYEHTGLTNDVEVFYRLAVTSDGSTEYTPVVSATPSTTALAAPQNVTFDRAGETSVSFKWDAYTDPSFYRFVAFYRANSESGDVTTSDTKVHLGWDPALQYGYIHGLTAETAYRVCVAAESETGVVGTLSSEVTCTTGDSTSPLYEDDFEGYEAGTQLDLIEADETSGFQWSAPIGGVGSAARVGVQAEIARSGTKALRLRYPESTNGGSHQQPWRFTGGRYLQEMWLEWWMYLTTGEEGLGIGPFSPHINGVKICRIWGGDPFYGSSSFTYANALKFGLSFEKPRTSGGPSGVQLVRSVVNSAGNFRHIYQDLNQPDVGLTQWPEDTGVLKRGTWQQHRLHIKVAAPGVAEAILTYWVDGELQAENEGIEVDANFDFQPEWVSISQGYLGGAWNAQTDELTKAAYWDDIKFYDFDPGWE